MSNIAQNEQLWSKIIVLVSVIVPVVVALLFYTAKPNVNLGIDLHLFPKFHAILNSMVTVLLLSSLYFIKQKNITAHKICNLTALVLSALFLVSYVTYHSLAEPTRYGGEGFLKALYLFILGTHIILAALILPIILFTFLRAFTGQFDRHRKLARWTMPLWLYVSITGVIVYFMISPYY